MLKDPNSVLDYGVSWAGWLVDADTIASSTWLVPDGLVKDSETYDDTSTTVWLSGGTVGKSYQITNRIMTDAGRTDDRTITISVRER